MTLSAEFITFSLVPELPLALYALLISLSAAFVGYAFRVVSFMHSRDEVRIANACFIIASLIAGGTVFMWGVATHQSSIVRLIICFVFFGLLGCLSVEAVRYVGRQRDLKVKVSKESEVTAPPEKVGPELIGHIEQTNSGRMVEDTNATGIMLTVRIKNKGTPSIAEDWGLTVTIPDKEPIAGQLNYIRPKEPVTFLKESKRVEFSPDEALYNKAIVQPIPSGGQVAGILVFILPNTLYEEFYRAGTVLELTFADVTGRKYSATHTLKGVSDETMKYYPGTKPPTIKDVKKKPRRK